MYKKLGVIGTGYVGTAIIEGMKKSHHIETYDKFKDCTCKTIEELCKTTRVIFLCVPTPMLDSGESDISIVDSVLNEINLYSNNHIVVIKSTVPPTTTDTMNKKYENVTVIFSPEFLTEANYIDDFVNSNRIIVGGDRRATTIVKNIFLKRFPKKKIIKTGATYAEMVKYLTNTFLATKVSFANEMKKICDNIDVDYDKVVEYARHDERLGETHWAAPGPDGKLGFGGSCFPKDLNALIYFSDGVGVDPILLKSVWERNLKVRPEKDWEALVGRAVTKGDKNV